MSSFINFNNKSDSAINLYSAEVIKEALLISETKSSIKATKIVENIKEPIVLNEALNLFTDKLTAIKSLSNAIVIVNEGRVKQFEMDFKDMVNDIKKGYGWIDPENVAQTWDNSSDSIDFSLVRDEIFDRLIDAGLLAHPDSSDPEKAGKKLKSAKELYAFENNETKLEEGKSITKIQKEYGQVVKDMVTTVEEWKSAEGDRKAELLEKLRALTAQKKDLLAQLDDAVGLKDVHAELAESVVNEKETLASAIEKEMDDNRFNVDVEFFTRDLRQIQNTKNHEDLHPSIKKVLKALKKKYRIKESVVTEGKGAKLYFDDLKYNYEKTLKHLDSNEKKEFNKLSKDFFSKLSESLVTEVNEGSSKEFEKALAHYAEIGGHSDNGRGDLVDAYWKLLNKKQRDEYFMPLAHAQYAKNHKVGWAKEVTEHHSENPNDKYEVRHCDKPETPYGVWEGDTLVKCFELEEDAFAFAKEQNKEQGLSENRELMAIDSYLNTKDEEVLIDFLDDAYGNSDDRKTRKEWEAARKDVGYNELIDFAVAHAENFGMDLQDIEDAIEVYEAKTINEKDDYQTHLDNLADLVGKANDFFAIGKELKSGKYKYDYTDSMMPMYTIKADGFKFAILNKRYVDGGDREVGEIAIGLMESVNERRSGQNSDDALILIQQALQGMKNMKAEIKGDTVIISNKAKDEFTYSLNDGGDVQEFIDELEESVNEASFDAEELYSEIEKDRKTEMISDIEDGSILFYHKDIAKGKAEVNVDGWSGDITIEVPGGPYGSGEWYGDQVSNMKDIDKQIKSYIKAEKSGEFEAMEESAVTEAKKYKFKELAKAWEFVYGEEMEDEYEGFYQEVVGKYKNKVTKADIAEIWNSVYGEDIATEYDGFFGSIKENLNTALKLDKLFEANADGTISDDEDERRAELLERVKEQMQQLLASAEFDAKDIGGSFRSPGIMAEIKKELNSQLKKFR